MASIVVGALLSASVKLLLQNIVSSDFVNFTRRTKLDVSLLEKLKITLLSLQAVLNDAEEKQITNPAIKEWLVMLQDAVFEVDNLFDEINTEALRRKVEANHEGQTLGGKVNNIFSSHLKLFKKNINSKMHKLFERLEYLRQQNLGLKESVPRNVYHGTPTYSFLGEKSSICGRDDDIKKLKDLLLSEGTSDTRSKVGVISIVGMGGLGKTTLAKLLYSDPEVKEKFELRGWAYISKDFDVFKITKTLFDSITSKIINYDGSKRNVAWDQNTLQWQLQQCLSNKTFLLVLDDIWYGSYVGLNKMSDIFNVGEMGSKIIITTRDTRVALPIQVFPYVHSLKPLEPEDCWSLIAKHAGYDKNQLDQFDLGEIGRQIANKCRGLPLAAIALGGLLRINVSRDYWNDVLKSNTWELTGDEVQPALLLSYRYLPAHLKGCFAYCSIFPKNSLLEKKMVVQLWIAEGLAVQPTSNWERWEHIAEGYFDELVARSLIERRSVEGEECFEMHDLVNDLATMVSSPNCMRMDELNQHESFGRVRHFSYNRGQYDSYNKFVKLHGLTGLRTFLALPLQDVSSACWLSNKVLDDLLPRTKQLRVLSLSNYCTITKLPNSIGNLMCLRYLNLSRTEIERLPSVTCKLYNLQTLLLSGCGCLTELPNDMGKLVNLRHLDIRGTQLKEMPAQIVRLENLQTLSDFVVSEQCDGLKIADLGKFRHIQGKLSILQLQNVNDTSDASKANLERKMAIDELVLEWKWHDTTNSKTQSVVLEKLRPSIYLKKLRIFGYGGNNFPNWLGDSLFRNMVYLEISNCRNCSWIPPLGQLDNLKEIFIFRMESIKRVGIEFYGSSGSPSFQPFPSLETLSFSTMPEWEEWEPIGGITTEFPSLKCLSLETCPKLKGNIPRNLPSLTIFEFKGCPLLMESGNSHNNTNIIRSPSDVVFRQLMLPPLSSLQKLDIDNFPSLTCFPREGLPKTLKSLKISNCENLAFLPHESLCNYTSLEDLEIFHSCSSMTAFTFGSLPVLKTMCIAACKNLKSILIAEDVPQQNLSFLRSITIRFCDELESFSLSGLPTPNLIYMVVQKCKKLCSLPEPINTLASLQEMEIQNLPNLQSIAKDGLPTGLQQLIIGSIGGILGNTLWERLKCLSVLRINSGDIVKALMKREVPLLPSSLVSLYIYGVEDIECLDGKWLRHLSSLHNLDIEWAPKLNSLPEGLPSSLSELRIKNCPLLEPSLQRKRGKEWRKIAHIRSIVIDNKIIT